MANIGICGCGAWGIGLAVLLNNNGHNVTMWSAVKKEVEMLTNDRENTVSLKGVKLASSIDITDSLKCVCTDKDIVIMAVASKYTRQTATNMSEYVREGQIIVNVGKGIEDETLMTLTDIISEQIPQADVTVLSGPSHAEEVGRGIPTTCVVGANTKTTAEFIQEVFMSNVFRVYTSPDILGIEIGGSLKNVIALAAGMADGLGFGDNTKAALITRGIAEIGRLGVKMGACAQTFAGLSGMGDLIVTCASAHSRNCRAGYLMGKGKTMDEAMAEVNQVVEGVYSARAGLKLSKKYDISMPIIEQVNKVLFEDANVKDAVNELMLRDKTSEISDENWK